MTVRAMLPERVALVIVGAGTAGAAGAGMAAAAGLRTLAIDRAPLARAGAQWWNAVPGWCFDRAGIARPSGPELVSDAVPFHLVAGDARVAVREHGALEVDMALLVERLQRGAREAGATLVGETRAIGVDGGVLRTDRGAVRADAIVDASGLAGARLLHLGEPSSRTDLCAAAQEVREVRDRAAAEALFARHDVPIGEVLSFVGTAGGYSVLNLRLHGEHVSMLTGSIPAAGHPSGRAMIERFAREHAWIGPAVRAGARAIPLGRPVDVLARGRVARLGDAARQLFSAHGSGIGAGLVAARVLTLALAEGGGLPEYASRWQREHGGLLAGYDAFRRWSQRLSQDDLARLIRSGLLDEAMLRPAMMQVAPDLAPARLAPKARAALGEAALVSGLLGVTARMGALRAIYAAYPGVGSRRLAAWSEAAALAAGDQKASGRTSSRSSSASKSARWSA